MINIDRKIDIVISKKSKIGLFLFLFIINILLLSKEWLFNSFSTAQLEGFRIVSYQLIFYFFLFPIGYIIVKRVEDEKMREIDFIIKIPIYIVVGIAACIVFFFILGFFKLNKLVVYLVFLLSWSVLLIRNKPKLPKFSSNLVLFLILFILSHFIFANVVYQSIWSPPGDAISHAEIISLFQYHEKIPSNYMPIADVDFSIWSYPIGLHLLGVVFVYLFCLFPGQSLLILAGTTSSLIPLIIYSTIYLYTKNKLASLFGFLLSFILPTLSVSWSPAHDLLLSNLICGTYPAHLSTLLIISLFSVLLLFGISKKSFLLFLIVSSAISITYYPYAILILIITIIYLFYMDKIRNIYKIFTVILMFTFLYYLKNFTFVYKNWYCHVMDLYNKANSLHFLSINGVIAGSGLIFFIYLYKSRTLRNCVFICYSVFVLLSLLSMNRFMYTNFIWFVYPHRFFLLVVGLSYLIFPILLIKTLSRLNKKALITDYRVMITYLLIILFFPTLNVFCSYRYPSGNRPTDTDYEGIVWIIKNTTSEELVLNDKTFTGLYLTSFRAQYVINSRNIEIWLFKGKRLENKDMKRRILEANEIFENPGDYERVSEIIKKYDIQYIFISSDDYYIDYCSEEATWKKREYPQEVYFYYFDKNPYLIQVYRKGKTGVYKVIKSDM
ncbi:hypothetical protein DRN73_06830 [Candidatus Pacearchaeota archaeon]|nr:MAG: hypothetical protein DRN73_06830 [Candidatus Pacearchaeota archaeon]